MLDIDALAKKEKENWVYAGTTCLRPKYERCLLSLSRGRRRRHGGPRVRRPREGVRQGWFFLPEAKSAVDWTDEDTIYVGTDFGPGSLTSSGYPRMVKEWKRGTPLAEAKTLFEGQAGDVAVSAGRDLVPGSDLDVGRAGHRFYESESFSCRTRRAARWSSWIAPGTPSSPTSGTSCCCSCAATGRSAGQTFPAGALLAANLKDYRAGKRELETLYEPGKNHSLSGYSGTKNALLLSVLEDVHTQVRVVTHEQGKWNTRALPVPALGSYNAYAVDDEEDDRYWFGVSDFLEPSSIELGDLRTGKRERLKSGPAFFKSDGLETKQFFTTSKDGTRIPYFQIARKDLPLDGSHPVLLTGYGGFEVPLLPGYNPSVGAAWLEQGGVYVVANIRGGGEYGPTWHKAGLKQNRQRVYDDFIAVAEDLIRRKVTRPQKLGIEGGSNGGLLMGVMFTQRPGPVGGRGLQRSAAGHEALPQAAGGGLLDERIRRPREARRVAGDRALLAVSKREEGGEVPAHPVHDVDARRPRASGPRAQDGRAHARAGARPAVLREHRGRPRGGGEQPAARESECAGVRVLEEAVDEVRGAGAGGNAVGGQDDGDAPAEVGGQVRLRAAVSRNSLPPASPFPAALGGPMPSAPLTRTGRRSESAAAVARRPTPAPAFPRSSVAATGRQAACAADRPPGVPSWPSPRP